MNIKLLAADPFGTVAPPAGYPGGGSIQYVSVFISILIKSLITMAAIYAVFNFVMAGYWYISGAGDPKRIADATAKIWQTVIGLIIAVGSLAISAIVGQLVFKNPNAILQIQVFTP